MVTIMIDQNNYEKDFKNNLKQESTVNVINTTFTGLDESQPVVFRIEDKSFYGRVSIDRLSDVIAGYADDLKIQTSRLFDVETKKYVSEFKYRQMVTKALTFINELDTYNSDSISKKITSFSNDNDLIEEDVIGALKIALIKTIKGPLLPDLLEGYGKEESELLIKKYLNNYKRRF